MKLWQLLTFGKYFVRKVQLGSTACCRFVVRVANGLGIADRLTRSNNDNIFKARGPSCQPVSYFRLKLSFKASNVEARMAQDTLAANNLSAFDRQISFASAEKSTARLLWLLILVMSAIAVVSFATLSLRIDLPSNPSLIAIGLAYAGVTWFYSAIRRDARLAGALTAVGQLFLVLLAGLMLTYAASAVGLPFRDANLYAADRGLGFDRQSYQAFVASTPGFRLILDAAYATIQPQTAFVPFILILTAQLNRLQQFVFALGISMLCTALIAAVIPAIDAFIYVDLAPFGESSIPSSVYSHIRTLNALRAGTLHSIRLNDLEGLIKFPSFHTTSAILFAWALWPIRYLRVLAVVVNGLMILSTPISGEHYAIDVIAGGIVAAAAIFAAKWIMRRWTSLHVRLPHPRT
jgi:membrane-associated phospholipid phosphatase